ncbi:MAG: chromosomal replication initiator protein DnaA [Candidatus Omnitrophota bacterium]
MGKPLTTNNLSRTDSLWTEALKTVKIRINPSTYNLWVEPLIPMSLEGGLFTVETPDSFFADWVQNHYGEIILNAVHSLDSNVTKVVFSPRKHSGGIVGGYESSGSQKQAPLPCSPRNGFGVNLNPIYTFENFIIGDSNRLAHAAALSVAQSPGTAYNPLFIYGQVGVGKTHLMQAIGNSIKSQINCRVAYLSSEQFLNEFIESLQNKSASQFRNKFRELDLLLIDDIQFIGGKEETQREFFHTFNALYDYHKQVVLSSDRPPKELKNMERRLVSRFEWGLPVDIQPPDLETRVAILNNKALLKNFPLSSEISFYLAERIEGNVRLLEGALNKLIACAGLYNKKTIDVKFIEEILQDFIRKQYEKKLITFDMIQEWVSSHFNVKISDLKSGRRQQSVVFPRQIAIYLSRTFIGASLPQIGEFFGGKNHTTILYTCRKIEDKIKNNVNFKEEMERIINKFKQDLNKS